MRKIIIIGISFLLFTTILVNMERTLSAPPPEPVTEYFYSDYSVYVSEEQSNKNFNSGTEKYDLIVGEGAEFDYNYLSFVKFSPIDLPDDADIQEAEIGLHLPADPGNQPINMYYIREPWYESSVTWNNKPTYKVLGKITGLIDTITVSTTGWHYWDATSLVEDWADGTKTNYGVAFESLKDVDFYFDSDDTSYYKPRLIITYLTSEGEPPEEPPEEPEDTTPCEIEYSVTPESPQSGDTVTISVTATDDTAMEYISIQKGGVEVEYCEAVGTVTTLTCSYSEVLYTPGATFSIFADDKGAEPTQGETFYLDVTGSGTPPVVSMDIEFRDQDAIPDSHRLLPGDNQMINITVTASDPDGINMMTISTSTSIPQDYIFDPPQTEVIRTLRVLNDDVTDREFSYYARVYDTEGTSTRVDGEDIEIDVPFQWYWGFPFENWGCPDNHTWSWSMMESIFGRGEVWLDEGFGWKRPRAERLYDNKVKEGGRNGHCFGMCAVSLEFAKPGSGLYPNYIQDTAVTIDDLERENWDYTWRYYYARQAGQYSKDKQEVQSDQFWDQNGLSTTTSSGLHPHMENVLNDIIDDLNDGNPGILGIRGTGGHAVIPWRVLPGEDGRPTKIYIYDPNRAYVSTSDSTDYSNTQQYPFIECGVDSKYDGWWSYEWNSTSTWDDNIYYFSYETVIGNEGEINYIGSAGITDQRLPSSVQITAMGSGDATFYAEDSTGRKTGIFNGSLTVEIPDSYPLFEFAGSDKNPDIFVYPSDASLRFYVESTVGEDDEMGSYSLILWDNSSFYALENTSCTKYTKDEITFTPRNSKAKTPDYSFKFRRGDVTKLRGQDPMDYSITIAKEFYNSPTLVSREYVLTSGNNEEGDEMELYVSDDYDDLVVETYDEAFEFSVMTRSTESLKNDPDIDYIPQSKGEFSLEANDKMVITPENWATTSASGSFSTSNEQTPGFELVLCIFAILFIVVIRRKNNKNS